MKIKLLLIAVMAMLSLSISQYASAAIPANISPQQIEQFKRLPEAQQRALAQNMGLDYEMIKRQLSMNGMSSISQPEADQTVYPRGTQFDEFGNPIAEQELLQANINKKELKPYGYDVFANAPQTFAPTMNIVVPQDYILGAGDTLSVQIFGKQNHDYQLPVSRQGQVVIPELGPFSVAGLTITEAKKFLAEKIKQKILGVDVITTLFELRSIRIFVAGDAFKPGPYVLSGLSSITHAIFAAGGINDIGSLRNIQLKRGGKLVSRLDLYDLLINGDSTKDVLLKSGDVVFVSPVGERVTIDGEVNRPAIYELTGGESFESVVKMAGGMLPSAYPSATVVERFNDKNIRTVINVNFDNKQHLAKQVHNGDVINVMKTSEQYDSSITVIGAVTRPGKYQWSEDTKVTDILPNIHAYMLADADLSYSIVVREKDIGRNIEIHQFSLFNAISEPQSKDNLTLEAHDKILVFSLHEKFRKEMDSLDALASTQSELLEQEKEHAREAHQDKVFWEEFGEQEPIQIADDMDETLKLAEKSMEELIGGSINEETDIRELGLFSRQRMLAPVIQKLQQQATSGEPIQLVEVVGAVKYPGIYPLAKNGQVKELLLASGGLLESAYRARAEITRNVIDKNGAHKESLNVNLSGALANKVSQNIALKSKDRLNVHVIPAWQENHIVELRGEFLFPGKYTIQRGETLSELIERAGGFTKFAFTEGSVFSREKLKKMELQNLLKVSESLRMEIASKSLSRRNGSLVDYTQAKQLLTDLTKVKPIGRLVVDLEELAKHKEQDVLLENGDVLYVPTKQNSINVIGQVQVATSHIFKQGLDAFDYVALSGGTKKQADSDRIYIIKANGSVEIPSSDSWYVQSGVTELTPGDTVVVPLDSEYMDNLTLWATGTQIIYQAAVAIAAISGI